QANGLPPLTVFRGCAQSSQCPATGSFTFSANVGIIQVTQTAECCNSDNCNSGPASAPAPLLLNGRQCHACLPGTTQCSFATQCYGVEDISSPSGTSPVIGCTSSNLCNDASINITHCERMLTSLLMCCFTLFAIVFFSTLVKQSF
uniref:UPAR/Ly6 domain-containing protein n=1 Tax=Gouania willdenowi TaxID=441366 RepID=A0A8C5DI65_GOUWI